MRTFVDDDFYSGLPELTQFSGVADPESYRPLPEGWVLAIADVVGSTQAIAEGRYKDVNMAGASAISAVLNALDKRDLPFVFGGDGAMVALPGHLAAQAQTALARMQHWVREELHLDMRAALVPLTDIRAAGHEVSVARFLASADAYFAMFTGGGASWAEHEMKAGRYLISTADSTFPDLTGLSCRWDPIPTRRGQIVSIIARPVSQETMEGFRGLVMQLIALTAELERASHPVPAEGPALSHSAENIEREVRAAAPAHKRLMARLAIRAQIWLVILLHRLHCKLGRFDARQYTRDVAANSDFRKFDDGLKMTVDVDDAHLERIRSLLQEAEAQSICEYGLHSQPSALMTCLVFSPLSRNHVHFIDGADGGYALAAAQLASRTHPPIAKPIG